MRTTVTLAHDVSAAVEQLRRERSIGVSEAVNELVRRGAAAPPPSPSPAFVQPTYAIGLRVDVTNVAEAIEELDGADGP